MSAEITIDGIAIAPEVLSIIVSHAVEGVEGVASVGTSDFTANLVSMFTARTTQPALPPVEAEVVDGALHITVRLTVFFGYPFKKLAEQVRTVVAKAIDGQVGVPVSSVDVCIDSLVFPKE
ncbi:Asp23/Gls24 family envelope stress response protein [Collinsella tanakaei]|uniref:Asp23/Gls24 family envelope stress response protein n=1 Tax=Collinsella tanakaei TaxID=626935 RepID=UPI001F2BCBC4|nr:Asp23/Gls24 family envelope stress response protein [Collinsella tanakaei]MCF2620771.1 Asp23/Gls24 family envelope stress response protein [Collinsella tanakaei]MDM8301317.1 Asp23/Gls24 family envelope stress response protein [Collinsella tanakaei]